MTAPCRLFSYGTLRDPAVQQELFGRRLDEQADMLVGWTLGTVLIDDDAVVGLSRSAEHLILRYTARLDDLIEGAVLALSQAELAIADSYETSAYVRIAARLASGTMALVNVDADDPASVAAGEALG